VADAVFLGAELAAAAAAAGWPTVLTTSAATASAWLLAQVANIKRKEQTPFWVSSWSVVVVWGAATTTIAVLPIVRLWVQEVQVIQRVVVVVAPASGELVPEQAALELNVAVGTVVPPAPVVGVVPVVAPVAALPQKRQVWVLHLKLQAPA
jgi:hypothetical protein